MRQFRFMLVTLFFFLASSAAFGQDALLQKQINRAISKGVASLKAQPINPQGGLLDNNLLDVGYSALVAWTLLEADVPATDEFVLKLTQHVRQRSIDHDHTYTISVLILLLDRLGDPGDEPLIESLALRLLAGQTAVGSWGYHCPLPDAKERQRLREEIDRSDEQRRKGEIGPSREKPSARKPRPESKRLLKLVEEIESRPKSNSQLGDHSNTQFAMLALWVARRHGVPVDEALARVAERFQNVQLPGGGWSYLSNFPHVSATMSCAGMLGLALGHGVKRKKDDKTPAPLLKDPFVKKGMRVLDEIMNEAKGTNIKFLPKPGYFHYFLFSMERMAVVYNLKKIGDKDWYPWGAKILVDSQRPNGQWLGEHSMAETCFALLFLKRANVAEDLTFNLMGITKDPAIKKKGPSKKPEPDPFELPKLIPKDKKKTKGASRHDSNEARTAGLHAHRAPGRDRDHRDLDRAVATGGAEGSRGRRPHPDRQRLEAVFPRASFLQ